MYYIETDYDDIFSGTPQVHVPLNCQELNLGPLGFKTRPLLLSYNVQHLSPASYFTTTCNSQFINCLSKPPHHLSQTR